MTTLRRSWPVLVIAGILSPLCTADAQVATTAQVAATAQVPATVQGPATAQVPTTDMLAARPIEFPAAVGEGQPREVRVISDDPAVKLVTITLRKGTVLPAHSAPVPVTIQALRGAGTIVVGPARHRLDTTHAIVLAAGTSHAIEPDAGTDMIVLVHHLGRAGKVP